MSLTFPRRAPQGVGGQHFELDRADFQTRVGAGRVSGVTAGLPLWEARWTLGTSISQASSDEWRAFLGSLRGQQRPFFGFDQARLFPKAYPNGFDGMTRAGGGAFGGAATSWSINPDGDEISPTGLPSGFSLTFVDYLMLRWVTGGNERRSLHRVSAPATANGAGVATLSIEPPVPTLVPGSAVADFAKPHCIMKLTSEAKLSEMGRSLRVGGTVVAIQDLKP